MTKQKRNVVQETNSWHCAREERVGRVMLWSGLYATEFVIIQGKQSTHPLNFHQCSICLSSLFVAVSRKFWMNAQQCHDKTLHSFFKDPWFPPIYATTF